MQVHIDENHFYVEKSNHSVKSRTSYVFQFLYRQSHIRVSNSIPKIEGVQDLQFLGFYYLLKFKLTQKCRWYLIWTRIILIWAIYSSSFTPIEFGFFRGLPDKLFILDIAGQFAFFIDIIVQFFVAYRDPQTYRMVSKRTTIALRYLKSSFIFDFLACGPWDLIYARSLRWWFWQP
ncbi:hypothetical protein MKX01_040013 [Papaver californicum]|nr:hypothetical protein MKX01_040013 [Papaver californicum]